VIQPPVAPPVADPAFAAAFQWLYPEGYSAAHSVKNAILAGTNKTVDDWNECIQEKNPHEMQTFISSDKLCEVDDPNDFFLRSFTPKVLGTLNRDGVPPHELNLKVDDVCILLRNLNNTDGLTNNTRVRIVSLDRYRIRIQTLGDRPFTATIPRIHFRFRLPYVTSYEISRTQFPLRLAYAFTFNKSQGQSLQKVLMDVRQPVFSHGSLYVGMSRVRHYKNIAFFSYTKNIYDYQHPVVDLDAGDLSLHNALIVKNIVYPDLL